MSAVRSWSSLDVAVLTLSSVMTNSVAVVSGEAVGFSDAEAISSLRISLLAGEAGFLDIASAALCFIPGTCIMVNLNGRVFSFKFLSLGLGMSSSDRSPKILSKGLWSTAMVRSSHPMTKYLVLSRAATTASASPSMGA